jgi:galactose mutarotase-like enzyme
MSDSVVIRSPDGSTSATIHPERGADVSSLIMPRDGRPVEWLYRRENFWTTIVDAGGSPFLFPVCGRHRLPGKPDTYTWQEREYTMPLHGFGMYRPWMVMLTTDDHVSVTLASDDETRTMYPFEFSVTLHYRVYAGVFTCRQQVTNHGITPMPYVSGFHPYFNMNEAELATCSITGSFDAIGTYNSDFTDIASWEPAGSSIPVVPAARSNHAIRLGSTDAVVLRIAGKPIAKLQVAGSESDTPFGYIQFYRSRSDPFICVEPWMGLPNALNRRDGAIWLSPGATRTATFSIASV